jgi:hypothetical protein
MADALTVTAWIRPDVLEFPNQQESGYVYWMGKGDRSNQGGNREWAGRMYSYTTTNRTPPNRISFYVHNPEGMLGVGSHVDRPVTPGEWLYIAGVVDASRTRMYRNGAFIDCDTYRGPGTPDCKIFAPDGNQIVVNPMSGPAPLRIGTRDKKSFFLGGMTRVRIWGRVLSADEIRRLYESDDAPRDAIVAEFLLNADRGRQAADTAKGNDGLIHDAAWATQA